MIKIGAFVASVLVLLAWIFDLQYSLLFGPIWSAILLFSLIILALVLSMTFLMVNGIRKPLSYVSLGILILVPLSSLMSDIDLGHRLHYLLNKDNLEAISSLSEKAEIFELTDMLRYQKRLNNASLSNHRQYISQAEIEAAFGDIISKQKLDSRQLDELRSRLEESKLISLSRTGGFLILTVDGFVDNEYGYIKAEEGQRINIGDSLPPFGFKVVRLVDFGKGWYFFYST